MLTVLITTSSYTDFVAKHAIILHFIILSLVFI
jgi:hypothetical protein